MLEFLRTDMFLIGMIIAIIVLIVLFIINTIKLSKIKKSYSQFMSKLGNNTNIEEDLRNYLLKVEEVQKENKEIQEFTNNLNANLKECIQKVGMVRYSAFSNVGSDLSFALALLDANNNGVVLNGIYASDSSNIYAKPITNGISTYALSNEEKEAIEKAKISEM